MAKYFELIRKAGDDVIPGPGRVTLWRGKRIGSRMNPCGIPGDSFRGGKNKTVGR